MKFQISNTHLCSGNAVHSVGKLSANQSQRIMHNIKTAKVQN